MSDKFGLPTDAQLEKINRLAKRTLSKDEVFTFPNKLVGDMIIPERYVQLTKELLDVFSADAKAGVSVLLDHSWRPDGFFGMGGRPKSAIPYGRTFDSRYEDGTEEGETISLVADHYMVRGIELDGIKTDDLIASIEAGTLFDSSIGFSYSRAICSVCGGDYRKCDHFAGRTYEIEDDDGVTRKKFCYIQANPPGLLMENSLVFDGAYPGAGVMSRDGDIFENENGLYQVVNDPKDIDPSKALISTYSQRTGLITMIKKSDKKKVFTVTDDLKTKDSLEKGGENMDEKVLKMLEAFEITFKKGETKYEDILSQFAEKWDETVNAIKESAESLKEGECIITQEQKTEYDAYRKELLEDALAMGVRAMGNDFPKETWEKTFTNMGAKAIKDIMKTWEAQANAEIPAGRKTDPEAGQEKAVSLPDEAFKVGK